MKIYSSYGINDFLILCGYKGYLIKEYFSNYFLHMSDITFDMKSNNMIVHRKKAEPWKVTLVDTGEATNTGGRLLAAKKYVETDDCFCFTYGDGLSDIDVAKSIEFHKSHGRKATITGVVPPGRYGALVTSGDQVTSFTEKPPGDLGSLINGGFFILNPSCIDLIDNFDISWEEYPLISLAEQGELKVFRHNGFWACYGHLARQNIFRTIMGKRGGSVENLGLSADFWAGKRVLVTGHSGFKGGWTCLMLSMLGAEVHGLSLPPTEDSRFFMSVDLENRISGSTYADITDYESCLGVIEKFNPDVIFHMAAQALVRASYSSPVETYMTNVLGPVNIFEAARHVQSVKVIVNVTTDKCYKNNEWLWPYREDEALGGHDPYSSSKACSEIVSAAYRESFFKASSVQLATARAGNVIGGEIGQKID